MSENCKHKPVCYLGSSEGDRCKQEIETEWKWREKEFSEWSFKLQWWIWTWVSIEASGPFKAAEREFREMELRGLWDNEVIE